MFVKRGRPTELDDDGNNKTARVAGTLPTTQDFIVAACMYVRTQYDYSVTSLNVLYRTWRGDGKAISSTANDFINHRSFPSSITPVGFHRWNFSTDSARCLPSTCSSSRFSNRLFCLSFSSFFEPPIWNNDDRRVQRRKPVPIIRKHLPLSGWNARAKHPRGFVLPFS